MSQTFSAGVDLQSLILGINSEKQRFVTRLILVEGCEVSLRRSRDHSQGCQEEQQICVRWIQDATEHSMIQISGVSGTQSQNFALLYQSLIFAIYILVKAWICSSSQVNFGF